MSQAAIEWDEEEDITIVDDANPRVEVVNITRFGNVPQILMDEKTAERCVACGRGPDHDRFDLGVKHVLNRLNRLFIEYGVPRDEAEAIVLRLRAADVELP